MFSSLDLLYLTLSLAAVTLTVVLIMLGVQLSQILGEARRTAESVERVSSLLESLAGVVLGGVEREAHRMDGLGRKIGTFIEKNLENIVTNKK